MRQVCNFTSERVSPSEGLIGSHILWYQGRNLLIGLKYSNGQVGALENVSITKRARPLCWRRKARIVAARAISSFRFLSLFPLSLCLLWFVFIYRRTRKSGSQWSRTRYAGLESLFVPPSSSLHPCVSLLLSSLRVPSSLDERRRERKREMKNRRCPSPPFLWNRFFRATVTERCLSFDELASSDLFAPLRYQSLPLVRSRSWADIIRKFASQSTVSGFPFPRWKGWRGQPIFCFVIASQKLGAMPI